MTFIPPNMSYITVPTLLLPLCFHIVLLLSSKQSFVDFIVVLRLRVLFATFICLPSPNNNTPYYTDHQCSSFHTILIDRDRAAIIFNSAHAVYTDSLPPTPEIPHVPNSKTEDIRTN